MKKTLSFERKDALREVMTIGAGNAATALSQLLGKKVNIDVPEIKLVPLELANVVFGSAEKPVNSVYLRLLGDMTGVILLTFEDAGALLFTRLLLGGGSSKKMGEFEASALKETATIVSGAYLSAMSKLLNMTFLISNPSLAQDMAGAIINNVLVETSKEADFTIIMDTNFCISDEKIKAYFFFIPETDSLDKLFKAIGFNGNG